MARIAAIVLAAGASSRMGSEATKASFRLPEGDTFLERIVRLAAAAGAEPVVVVTGAFPELRAPPPACAVHNAGWAQGQLSSLKIGLDGITPSSPDGALVALVDHPLVRPSTYIELTRTFGLTRAPVVRPIHSGRRGHPVIFSADLFHELTAAALEGGARSVVSRHHAVDVEVDDPGILVDLDTRDDLDAAGLVPTPTRS